jgi:hypothetical protein
MQKPLTAKAQAEFTPRKGGWRLERFRAKPHSVKTLNA